MYQDQEVITLVEYRLRGGYDQCISAPDTRDDEVLLLETYSFEDGLTEEGFVRELQLGDVSIAGVLLLITLVALRIKDIEGQYGEDHPDDTERVGEGTAERKVSDLASTGRAEGVLHRALYGSEHRCIRHSAGHDPEHVRHRDTAYIM